jgi:hypothetical protein
VRSRSLIACHVEEEFYSDHHARDDERQGNQVRVVIPYPVPSRLLVLRSHPIPRIPRTSQAIILARRLKHPGDAWSTGHTVAAAGSPSVIGDGLNPLTMR